MLEETDRNLPTEKCQTEEGKVASGKEVILEVLARAADDRMFLARLAENPSKVLREYDLTPEERSVLARGDIRKIESWVGKLDERLKIWLTVRRAQDEW